MPRLRSRTVSELLSLYAPVRHLAPLLLVPDHVDDLPLDFTIGLAALLVGREVDHDETPPLDPYRVAEPLRELGGDGLPVGQLAAVQVVALGLADPGDGLVLGQLVWRAGGLLGCCHDVALGSAHIV
ncbi:hypothetical protein VPNG_04100 [Cytospora leucostoma]|uniref:Uncharacterized protein n=1 Tax=Cytospora leucostoma TaxID=1230097 RepID=A0A423XDR3_9PEZI|nr:hypothetical protein VPNG_04100 [Cytospora leucostoma]